MNISKRKVLYTLIILFLFTAGFFYYYLNNNSKDETEIGVEETRVVPEKTKPKKKENKIKSSVELPVPYTVQAPNANWAVHEESCEEAAVLMYHYFLIGKETFSGSTVVPAITADKEFRKMKTWQVNNYGIEPDLSIEKLGAFMESYYGYNYRVYKNITSKDIKRELSRGNPVLVPVMTHGLNNPHYGPKSVYHILLIKGYNAKGAIANDAGIKEGESAIYPWSTVFAAIDGQTPKMGQKRVMLVVMK